MKVLFRTDASQTIGSGHVMRCLSLAHALRKKINAECSFACLSLEGHLQTLIQQQGFQVFDLGNSTEIALEAESLLQQHQAQIAVDDRPYDWLVIDHYQRDASFESLVRPLAKKIMVIDELQDRNHDCDLLLDQWLTPQTQDNYQQLIPEHCERLFGLQYALLREEFQTNTVFDKSQSQRLLISFGGMDLANNSRLVLQALAALNWQSPVDLVLGQNSPWNAELQQEFAHLPYVNWHIQCDYMGQLMRQARLAIGAGGGSHLERCISSLPSIVLTVAENQIAGNERFAQFGVCLYLGEQQQVSLQMMCQAITNLWSDSSQLTQMAINAHYLIPNNGCNLVVESMQSLLIS